MTIRVSVIGYDLLGKRIADAVAQQLDMDLVGVFDDDPCRQVMIARRGYSLLSGHPINSGCQAMWPCCVVPIAVWPTSR